MRGSISMPTTEAAATSPSTARRGSRIDPRFARQLVILNGAVPLALLGWDALHHKLGVNAVNYAIRTTGLLGLIFLVGSLAVTPLRRLTGWNELIAPRRAIGLYAFFYVALHFTIFALLDRGGSLRSTVHEIVTRRYLQIGTAGLLLMVPLAVTSTDRMLEWLGPRRWKALHRLAYVSAVAGAVHYVLLVKADVRQPLAFAGVLAALLLFRVVGYALDRQGKRRTLARARSRAIAPGAAPARPRFWSGELRVARTFDETPDVRTFRLATLDGGALPFAHQPGQYLTLDLTIGGARVRRSYTIASSPTHAAYCEVTIKRKGDGHVSRHMHDGIREGDVVKVSAPSGRFTFTGTEADRVVLLAGGVGITPLMSIVRYLTDRSWPGDIYLVVAARKQRDIIFQEELGYLQRRFPRLHVRVILSDEDDAAWTGARGRIDAGLLADFVPALSTSRVYVCGPDPMMAAMRRLLGELGVPEGAVQTEAFVSPAAQETGAGGEDEAPATGEPAAAPPLVVPGAAGLVTLRFERAGRSIDAMASDTLLESAESAGIDLPFECRSGVCGQCKTRLLRGQVTMETQDALTASDRARGVILACQARPRGDVVVDA
jgi:ferredoxin-NADP reductase/DMSO/TMAO reductase YedYZ heme-binding membrane subunit